MTIYVLFRCDADPSGHDLSDEIDFMMKKDLRNGIQSVLISENDFENAARAVGLHDDLVLVGHGNQRTFSSYSDVNNFGIRLAKFILVNKALRHIVLNACCIATQSPGGSKSFCSRLATQLKIFLPEHPYLKITGFIGQVFTGVDGGNYVWKLQYVSPDSQVQAKKQMQRLKNLTEATSLYEQFGFPQGVAQSSLSWEMWSYVDKPISPVMSFDN